MVKLRHASLTATTGAGLGRNWLPKNITDDLSSTPASKPVTNKDLPDLASIELMTQVIGLFGHMCSSLSDLDYYQRVTF